MDVIAFCDRNAIIMGRDIKEDSVCRDPFLEMTDIGSRKVGLKVLMEWIMNGSIVELGCKLQGFADMFNRYPGQIQVQGINIRQAGMRTTRQQQRQTEW